MTEKQPPRGASAGPATRSATGALNVGMLGTTLDEIAPCRLAAEWDNVGLIAGSRDWPVRSVLLALDLTDPVAEEALDAKVDALVLYHPPIFKGVRTVTSDADTPTRRLPDLLAARVSLFAVHTALDAAVGGTNDVLLDAFAPAERHPLEPTVRDAAAYKLAVFAPAEGVARLRAALAAAGAGTIGHYAECSFELSGHGTFRGDESARPAIGRAGQLERVAETRLEMVVAARDLPAIVQALYAHHSYEEPAFDLYPLRTLEARGKVGLGRVGILAQPQHGGELLAQLGRVADLTRTDVVGQLQRQFDSVTVAAGSFGVRAFADPKSLVITGEFKHHDALELLRRGVTAVRLGHYASERPALEALARRLARTFAGLPVNVARSDRCPFRPVSGPS